MGICARPVSPEFALDSGNERVNILARSKEPVVFAEFYENQ
jgi:hypothetical protein